MPYKNLLHAEVYRGLSRNIAGTGTFMVAVRFYSSILTQLDSKVKKRNRYMPVSLFPIFGISTTFHHLKSFHHLLT